MGQDFIDRGMAAPTQAAPGQDTRETKRHKKEEEST
jgi:hypothetical protein